MKLGRVAAERRPFTTKPCQLQLKRLERLPWARDGTVFHREVGSLNAL